MAQASLGDPEQTQKVLQQLLEAAAPELEGQREEQMERMQNVLEEEQDRVYQITTKDGNSRKGLQKRRS